ncbi:MAG: SpoIIE family protein phosphatase [Oscillospiraceae bacterium]
MDVKQMAAPKRKPRLNLKLSSAVAQRLCWAGAAFLLELSSPQQGAAPCGAALAAGLSGANSLAALAGTLIGAVLHGIPDGIVGASAAAIVLAGRLIPDVKNIRLRCVVKCLIAIMAVFFSRIASAVTPSELLGVIIASLGAGVFAVCLCLFIENISVKGFELSRGSDCTLAVILCFMGAMSVGMLDYPFVNPGRLILAIALLSAGANRGIAFAGLIGGACTAGFYAAGVSAGFGAAIMVFAALVSQPLGVYGKLTRSIAFVFSGCAAVLIMQTDSGAVKLFGEMAAAGLIYTVIPLEKLGAAGSEFSDKTVAMLLKERLCFAADAISGISSGLNAAAESLGRRYSTTIEDVSERAADRACRTCPNSMVCWGQKYEVFHAEFDRLVKMKRSGAELTEQSFSTLAAEECIGRKQVIGAINAEYARFLNASADERRIRELRRIYTEQLASMREILEEMGRTAGCGASKNKAAEQKVERAMSDCGLKHARAYVSTDSSGRLKIEAYSSGELRTEREYLGELLTNATGRELSVRDVSGADGLIRLTAGERTRLSADVGVFQLCRGSNRVCGDCCESFNGADGKLYVVISDGMGSGSRARMDSALACNMLVRLLKSGIPLSAALETVNTSLLVKSPDESFATLDICELDLDTGECTLYKAGAAVTYIRIGDKLVRATLSSPPVGSGGRLTVPAQKYITQPGDVIIMTTDGASPDEDWLMRELSAKSTAYSYAEHIARASRAAENGRDDDISVIAVVIDKG